MSPAGKVARVAGGRGGIGPAIRAGVPAEGAAVLAADRSAGGSLGGPGGPSRLAAPDVTGEDGGRDIRPTRSHGAPGGVADQVDRLAGDGARCASGPSRVPDGGPTAQVRQMRL